MKSEFVFICWSHWCRQDRDLLLQHALTPGSGKWKHVYTNNKGIRSCTESQEVHSPESSHWVQRFCSCSYCSNPKHILHPAEGSYPYPHLSAAKMYAFIMKMFTKHKSKLYSFFFLPVWLHWPLAAHPLWPKQRFHSQTSF